MRALIPKPIAFISRTSNALRVGGNVVPSNGAKTSGNGGTKGFSILELLVAMTLVVIVAGLSFSIMNAITSAWSAHKALIGAFGDARVVFEALTHRLSQATLNTYWDYDNRGKPSRYLRKSELHYMQGKAESVIPEVVDGASDAVFFVAPLGIYQERDYQPLAKMLSACGFYVRFGGETNRPEFLEDKIPQRFRYRLYQFIQPGERLSIYSSGNDRDWYREELEDWSFPMADNVIGLILRARNPDGNGGAVRYDYDSRFNPNPASPLETLNQLPPIISATLVVIDEDSARQLEARYDDSAPPILPAADAFTVPERYEQDMADWELLLQDFNPRIDYRVLTADISIRGAKWSSE